MKKGFGFKNIPLNQKLSLLMVIIGTATTLLASGIFVTYDLMTYRDETKRDLTVLAQVIGLNSVAALYFNDHDSAQEVLAALKVERGIVGACIHDKTGEEFAHYYRQEGLGTCPARKVSSGHYQVGRYAVLHQPIVFQGEQYGSVYLQAEFQKIRTRLQLYGGVIGFILLACLLLAFVLSAQLRRLITDPILHLVKTARHVTENEDYTVRAMEVSQDEIGDLSHAFNDMLSRVHSRDVKLTEVKESLEDISNQLDLILNSVGEGILGLDGEGVITFANNSAARLLESTTYEMTQKFFHKIFSHHKENEEICNFEDCSILTPLQTGSIYHDTNEVFQTKNGKTFNVEVMSTLMREGGRARGVVLLFKDISERKKAEKDLKRAKEEAEVANRTKSVFLANMSHEIRTPLYSILGLARLVKNSNLSDTQKEQIYQIQGSGESLLDIISDILDFSKIEAGILQVDRSPFHFRDLLQFVFKSMENRVKEKGLDFSIHIDTNLPSLFYGDPLKLRQILINLIGNAIKFTEKGSIQIRIQKENQSETDVQIKFSIKDTGIGISEEGKNHLFQSFSQVDHSTSRSFGGTGLGLAISKRFVEIMGGKIDVESQRHVGSTFFFTIGLTPFSKVPFEPDKRDEPSGPKFSTLILSKDLDDEKKIKAILAGQIMALKTVSHVQDLKQEVVAAIERGHPYDIIIVTKNAVNPDVLKTMEEIRLSFPFQLGLFVLMERAQADIQFDALWPKSIQDPDFEYFMATLSRLTVPSHGWKEREVPQDVEPKKKANKILVVEDNILNQKVTVLILEKMGFMAKGVGSGQEALADLETNPVDLILMDCQMPDMDGYTASKEFRKKEKPDQRLPIIAMTANAFVGEREKCLQNGMDDFIPKPVKPEVLQAVLNKWLS